MARWFEWALAAEHRNTRIRQYAGEERRRRGPRLAAWAFETRRGFSAVPLEAAAPLPRLVVAVAMGVASLACSSLPPYQLSPSPAPSSYRAVPPPRPGGVAVLTDYRYPETLSPLAARGDLELRLGGLVFSPLWSFDDKLRPYPDLARQVPTVANAGVRVASDGRSMSVTVRLLPGLRWSDGTSITSDDVIFTWRAVTDAATGAFATPDLERITRMDRRSDEELVWTFDGVYAAYLQLGAALLVMPAHRLRALPHQAWALDPFFQRPDVASGPFLVREAVPEQHLVFEANPHYADGRTAPGAYPGRDGPLTHRAYLERIVFRAQPAKEPMMESLRAGAADAAFHFMPADLPALQGVPGLALQVSTGLRDEFLNPNHRANTATGRVPPWVADPRVLEALDRALDRAVLAREVTSGAGRPARGLFPRALSDVAAGIRLPFGRDLDAARRLLETAGWRPGPDGVRSKGSRRLDFGLVSICGRPDLELELLRKQWSDLGAAVTTGCQSRAEFFQLNAAGAFDMTLYSNQWAPDPAAWASAGTTGRPENWNRCAHPPLDRALARGESTLDGPSRREAYREAERQWLAYRCTIPLFEWADIRLVSTRLRNFAPSPGPGGETWNAADWWLAAS